MSEREVELVLAYAERTDVVLEHESHRNAGSHHKVAIHCTLIVKVAIHYIFIGKVAIHFTFMGKVAIHFTFEDGLDRILIGVTFPNNFTFRPDKKSGAEISRNGCSDVLNQ